MDRDRLLELVPHYVALVAIVFAVLTAAQALAGGLGFWIELAIIFVIALAYRPVVVYLGVAPSAWEE